MAKRVTLSHAEVTPVYGSNDQAYNEFKSENTDGILFSFSVKTKVNDRVDNSPVIFDKCGFWAKNGEEQEMFRNNISIGSIIDIKGFADRQKSKKENKWYDQINVKEIIPIQTSAPVANDDDLPF